MSIFRNQRSYQIITENLIPEAVRYGNTWNGFNFIMIMKRKFDTFGLNAVFMDYVDKKFLPEKKKGR